MTIAAVLGVLLLAALVAWAVENSRRRTHPVASGLQSGKAADPKLRELLEGTSA